MEVWHGNEDDKILFIRVRYSDNRMRLRCILRIGYVLLGMSFPLKKGCVAMVV